MLQAMTNPDWAQGLPLGVLSLVAGGRDGLKVMREVCPSWKQEYEHSVSKITEDDWPPLLATVPDLANRFPGLTSLQIHRENMGQTSIGSLSSLRKLADLYLYSEVDFFPPDDTIWWTAPELEALHSLPALRSLTIASHAIEDLQSLRGLQLTSLELFFCTAITNLDGLQGLPLASFRLVQAPLLKDAGLESLRGMHLTSLDLDSCPLMTDSGLEVFRRMLLATLHLGSFPLVTDSGLEVLRAMPMAKLDLDSLPLVTEAGLEVFHGMQPLQDLTLRHCEGFTPVGCVSLLRDLQLTKLDLHFAAPGLTDVCLEVRGSVQ